MPKTTTDALPQISISWLKNQGYFKDGIPLLKDIGFTSSECYFGGKRFWFTCKCGNRVSILYESGDEFRCRKCLNLAYPSQNIRKSMRNDVLLSAFDDFLEAQELQNQANRITYRGELTKKQQKIELLYLKFYLVMNAL